MKRLSLPKITAALDAVGRIYDCKDPAIPTPMLMHLWDPETHPLPVPDSGYARSFSFEQGRMALINCGVLVNKQQDQGPRFGADYALAEGWDRIKMLDFISALNADSKKDDTQEPPPWLAISLRCCTIGQALELDYGTDGDTQEAA